MMRFVIVASSARGTLAEEDFEPLDDANQWRALESADVATAEEIEILRHRATRTFRLERDPVVSAEEERKLRRPVDAVRCVEEDRIDRMMGLAFKQKAS